MKKYISKKIILFASVALLLSVSVGTTLAYVFTNSGPIKNIFKPSKVSCAVVENRGNPVSGAVTLITGKVKKAVQIKNTGDTDAYIRVAVVVNWASEDGSKIWAQKPVVGRDYTINYDLSNGWIDGGDGFFYYSKAVSPGSSNNLTSVLIEEAGLKSDVTAPTGTDSTQYYFSIEIVASAIQPTAEAVKAWSNGVVSIGTNGDLQVTQSTQP